RTGRRASTARRDDPRGTLTPTDQAGPDGAEAAHDPRRERGENRAPTVSEGRYTGRSAPFPGREDGRAAWPLPQGTAEPSATGRCARRGARAVVADHRDRAR